MKMSKNEDGEYIKHNNRRTQVTFVKFTKTPP